MSSRRGRIFKTDYHTDEEGLAFDIYGRDVNGEKFHIKVYNVEPYFYTKQPSRPSNHHKIKKIERKGRNPKGKKLWKITTGHPYDVSSIRDLYEPHYEADILFRNRKRYDYGWKSGISFPSEKVYDPKEIHPIELDKRVEPRLSIVDIETWDESGDDALDSEEATAEVKAIGVYDSFVDKYCCILNGAYNSNEHELYIREKLNETDRDITWEGKVVTAGDEIELFNKFNEWLSLTKPDIMTGWNFIDYDFDYMTSRTKKLRCDDVDYESYAVFDVMKGNDRMQSGTTRNKLNIQAQKMLGVGKLQVPPIYKLYKENRAKLVAYNLLDVILTKEIDQVMGVTSHHAKLSQLCGVDIDNCLHQSKMVDAYVLHRLSGAIQLPSKKYATSEKKKDRYKGGHVEEAFEGLLEHIGVADFKSEYPMVIIQFNISPETYVEDPDPDEDYYISPNGNHYMKKPEGVVPKILRELLEEREEVKKEMHKAKQRGDEDEYNRLFETQRSIKVLMNSFYGVLGSGAGVFRLANKELSSDVTAFAREHIHFTSEVLKNAG